MGTIRGNFESGKNLERLILELEIDEEGWADPDALEMHYEYNHYLYLEEPISKNYDLGKNKVLYIKRTGPNKDDFFVDTTSVKNYIWERFPIDDEDYEDALTDPTIAILEYEKSQEPKSLFDQIKEAENKEDYERAQELQKKLNRE